MMYAAAVEWDYGEDEGGGLYFLGLYADPARAVLDALEHYRAECDPTPDDEWPDYWSRADVWSLDETDEERAHCWVLDKPADLDGDVLHLDSGMWGAAVA